MQTYIQVTNGTYPNIKFDILISNSFNIESYCGYGRDWLPEF